MKKKFTAIFAFLFIAAILLGSTAVPGYAAEKKINMPTIKYDGTFIYAAEKDPPENGTWIKSSLTQFESSSF